MAEVPKLRRDRSGLSLTKIAARFHGGVREVEEQIEPYARWWDEANAAALEAEGPLWVAFGDSTAQGIGADEPSGSYVGQALMKLRDVSGQPWRVLNLSMTGARFADVSGHQVPAARSVLNGSVPALVTCVVGTNDVLFRWGFDGIVEDARAMVEAVPDDTLLGRLGSSRGRRRIAVNEIFATAEAEGGVDLFDVWVWPDDGERRLAADGFHPNDLGYEMMADALMSAVRDRLGL
ncbi:MAG: SGNH/GDSL hydrolase family protein [Acidimicrobiales bacterium]